jgi:hypothetical protein
VVVHDLNVCRANVSPYEADAPLIIDSYAVLTLSIVLQRFQVVVRISAIVDARFSLIVNAVSA